MNWGPGAEGGFQNALAMGLELGKAARAAAERERENRERKDYRNALGVLAGDPGNSNALASVFQYNPDAGVKLANRAEQMAFGRDAAEMMAPGGQPNALLGLLPSSVPAAAPAAPVAAQPEQANDGPDLSVLGEPQTGADQAFLRMVRRDPIEALNIRSALRDDFVDQAKAEADFYGLAMGELSRATDQASWSAGLQAIAPRAEALGFDLSRAVPAEYPGEEGVRELMARSQPVKEQLDLILRTANIEADNTRADRSAESLIATRDRRASEYERRGRAGEAIRRRGQDMADRRTSGRGARSSGGLPAADALPTVSSPAEAAKLPKGTRFRTPDGRVKIVP
jgi:hypothetical protein